MKEVLVVSIAFPPKNDPECLQAARYVKFMVRSGLKLRIVTSAIPTLFMPYDATLEQYNFEETQKVSIPIFETKISNFLLRKINPAGINFPDSKFSFFRQWRKAVRQIKSRPDVIYSRSNPVSSALMAFNLQQHYNVPWVMHLSDPWVGSPVIHYTAKEYSFNRRWEELCFNRATRISFTTEKTLDFYTSRYPLLKEKFFISPNVFDPEVISSAPISFSGPLKIVYTGGLAGNRTPEFFLEACRQVLKVDARLGKCDIIFAGPIDRSNKTILETSGLPFVTHIGNLTFKEAQNLQQQAHILLTIDECIDDARKSMFFPSKILDYFVARRIILALTNQGSSTSEVLSSVNAAVVCYPDIERLKEFLVKAMNAFDKNDIPFFTQERLPEKFSAQQNAIKLVSLLQSL